MSRALRGDYGQESMINRKESSSMGHIIAESTSEALETRTTYLG